jgi:gliding motility-associated-like protein
MNARYYFTQQEKDQGFAVISLQNIGPEGCPNYTDKMTIDIEEPPSVYAGQDEYLCIMDETMNLSGQLLEGNCSIYWEGGMGEFTPDNHSLDAVYQISEDELDAGTIQFILHSSSLVCPNVSDTVSYILQDLDVSSSQQNITCHGLDDGRIQLIPGANAGTYTYHWSNGSSATSIDHLEPGSYCVTITNENICEKEKCFDINEPDPISILISKFNVSCNNKDLGNAFAQASGGSPPYTYQWSNDSTTNMIDSLEIGHYSVTIMDSNKCEAYQNVIIERMPDPVAIFDYSDPIGCVPHEVDFIIDEFNDDYIYTWTLSSHHDTVIYGNAVNHTFNQAGFYDLTLNVRNLDGCDSTYTLGEVIEVYNNPAVQAYSDKETAYQLQEDVQFYMDYNQYTDFWVWDFGTGDGSYHQSPIYHFPDVGFYDVTLYGYNDYCTDTSELQIEVRELPTFYVPTAIQPKEDGVNSIFKVFGNGIIEEDFLMLIYNRWGELIFESSDIDIGWDGTKKNGKTVENGTYTWRITYRDSNSYLHTEIGSVTVIH